MKKLILATSISMFSLTGWAADLPENLNWQTNWDAPKIGSPDAKRGGVLRSHLSSFPQTLRTVGPDSNSGLRSYFLDEMPSLVKRHPDTLEWIPDLANEWAYGDDHKTIYFKLNPEATWSDGEPVTADDFVFMMQFYRSKDIVAPWYNDYYTNTIGGVEKIDQHTIAISTAIEKSDEDLMYTLGSLVPRPAHFYANPRKDENQDGIADDFVRRYNFKATPTLGPYELARVQKGRSVTFEHVDDWWGYTNPYYQHRYNVDKIRLRVIRDNDIAMKHFEKGNLDVFDLLLPDVWHDKTQSEPYKKGYIIKFWGHNEVPVGAGGLWMNTAMPLLDDINVRKGIIYATDFDGMIENITRGDYSRKPHAMGHGHGEYDNDGATPPPFDPKKAISYFEKAGFDQVGPDGIRVNDKGERLSFAITYGYQHHTPRIAYLKEQAKQAGLDFTIHLVDGSSAFKYVREKKHQLAFLDMGTSEIPAYWQYFHSDNANKKQTNNHTNYSSPALDKLIMAYKTEFDMAKKYQLSHQIRAKISEASVIVPGYMVPYVRQGFWRYVQIPDNAMTKRTEKMVTSGRVMGFGTFWIDEEMKDATEEAMDEDKAFEPVTIIDDRYKL
ncbi:ABC transporter substrate-binding protein [Salinivibrio sp. PR6]|uniref:extracellular solute-binding protein n=1 Tax=Salinivibrio sp. PR6 TaxID=1909485 RepID=UPI0009891945|nr:extracellular solute-binding protein [Salinivibrio sp. PR6]OOE83316.1 ABC transporter substrate-binding protein [Salinivibrio sp. PR6]